jgi:hypothetical protein
MPIFPLTHWGQNEKNGECRMVFADPQLEEAGTGLALGLIAAQDAWEFQFADEAEVVVGKKTAAPLAELTTTALDALDAEQEEASAMQAELPAGEALELADIEILQSRDEAPAPQTGDLPQPAEDAAPSASDAYEFDADLQAIFAMYKGFVPPEGDLIVIAPPPDGGMFLQVITQGPDGKWYTDSSLTTPIDDETLFGPIAICPVIGWDGSPYLPEPGSDVLLG